MPQRRPCRLVCRLAGAAALLAAGASAAAPVSMSISGSTASGTISLDDGLGHVYSAELSIVFDTPQNLTSATLNVDASLVAPADPTLAARLCAPASAPCGIAVDAAFPVLVTVEPPNFSWLFQSGFEANEATPGNLSFRNAYSLEIHTTDLAFAEPTPYRLMKAPLSGNFRDYSATICSGSVRARGRDGGFSQFLIASDTRPELVSGAPVIALGKLMALQNRLNAATLPTALRTQLDGLLTDIASALSVLDYAQAITKLDQFRALVQANAGGAIANLWRAERDLVNDAGDLDGLAASLRFSLVRLNGGGSCAP